MSARFRTSDDGVLVLGFADEFRTIEFVTDDGTAVILPVERRRSFIPSVPLPSRYHAARTPFFNVSSRRIGGLRFIKVGRLCLSVCITSTYRPL